MSDKNLITGILDERNLPDQKFNDLWESIILNKSIKDRLLAQSILNFTLRDNLPRDIMPLHGIILLTGPPGTGKTSLARGLSSMTAKYLSCSAGVRYLEVEPHSLTSSALGKSQRAVTELLNSTVAEYAAISPTIVVLDEVETLATDRSRLSMEANPVDVHRATDAVLAQLDYLADKFSHLLFIATSNFTGAIDEAFVSRADLVMEIGRPDQDACRKILTETIKGMARIYPEVVKILEDKNFDKAVELSEGLDGRKLRKLVASACTFNKDTALNPGKLTANDILQSVKHENSRKIKE